MILIVHVIKTLKVIPDKATIITEAVMYMADHLKIKLEQSGNHYIKAKLILEMNDSTQRVISEDSMSYEPRPTLFC